MKTNQGLIIFSLMILMFIGLTSAALAADEYAGKKASLWRDNSYFTKMYSDPVASTINDIVTIRVIESSTASNKASLETSKKTTIAMGIDNFLGFEKEVNVNDNFDSASMIKGTTNNSNQGEGESTRQSTLTAYISARVIDVMPNGNLVIEAKKEVIVNKEKQVAVLTGIIRPRDIEYNNVIASNKIADMQIKFIGKGPVTAQTRRGWLSWLLGVIWPF